MRFSFFYALNFVNCQKITNFVRYSKILIMKRLIYTFALLFVTLSAIGANLAANKYIYFAKPSNWTASYCVFMIGHDSYSSAYTMTNISNTNLYYWKSVKWDNYKQWAVFNTTSSWNSGEGKNIEAREQYAVAATWRGTSSLGAFNLIPTASVNATTTSGYSTLLNKTHTIKTQLDNTDNANVGDVTAKYYQLTSETSTGTQKSSSITSASSGTISVVYTSQVTLTATPATGYTFLGWYEGSTRKTTSTTYTYTAENSIKTVVAKFTKQPTVRFTNTETEVGVGYKFVPTVESANLTNPTYTYTVKYNNGGATPVDASGYVLDKAGEYVFTVTATGTNGSVTATHTINVVNFYVAGTKALCDSEWNASDANNVMTYSDGVFTKIFTDVPKGNHEFKITDGSWDNSWGYGNVDSDYSSSYSANGDNIKFTLDTIATVIISYNNSTDKIELKVVYDNFEVGEKIYFSSDKGGSVYAAYLFGESGETWVNLSQEYANIYSATVPNGNWGGVIFCSMKSETLDRTNINSKTKYLEYEGKNWYKWTNESEWRNFENLIYADQKLYFKPDSNWESANARFAAYYWDVLGENRWVDCVYDSVDHAYHVVAPIVGEGVNRVVWTNIKFVRMKPNSENNWENDWNTTPDLVYDGANDFFIIKLTDKDWDNADPNNWISFSHPFEGAIFFEPNASLKAAADKRFSIYLWNGFNEYCWVKMQPMATHPDIYCVVIPEGYWTGANICSMNPATDGDSFGKDKNDEYIDLLNQTNNLTYHSDKLLYRAPDKWDFMVPADECWAVLDLPKADDVDCSADIQAGVYYTYFKRTLSISTPADIAKWHWISLPYNVKISDIQGGVYVYGADFIIQEYDTEARAKWENNIAAENESAWRMMEAGETLLAGKGYILAVDNKKSSYSLTFVSETDLNVVADIFNGNNIDYPNANVPESANWHLIGTGLYGAANSFGGVDYVAVPQGDDYLYYNLSNDGLANINAYTAFFVQHAGDYSFSKVQPAQNAAPRRVQAEEKIEHYYVNIVGMADTSHTAIFLADDGSDDYVVGKDFLHLGASGASLQLYTLQGESTLSFNYLKREDRTVLVGGYVAQSGKYTISLDAEGDASAVTLYDATTGLVADLLNENYEFEAEKGILDGRFSVIISYAAGDGPTTMIGDNENVSVVVSNYDGIAHFEGLLVGESVVVYDVMGRCVTQFVAENDKADVMLISGVYMLYHNGETVKFVVNR